MKLRNNLFCYGTLMFKPIMQAVSGVIPTSLAGRLRGYASYTVREHPFPGIVLQPGSVVNGVLYMQLTPLQMRRLDDYESDFYERVEVNVETDTGQIIPAYVYRIPERWRHVLSTESWDADWFARHALSAYLQRLRRGITVT